jgi:hypothetical protein
MESVASAGKELDSQERPLLGHRDLVTIFRVPRWPTFEKRLPGAQGDRRDTRRNGELMKHFLKFEPSHFFPRRTGRRRKRETCGLGDAFPTAPQSHRPEHTCHAAPKHRIQTRPPPPAPPFLAEDGIPRARANLPYSHHLSPLISPHLPSSPRISPHLPASPRISPDPPRILPGSSPLADFRNSALPPPRRTGSPLRALNFQRSTPTSNNVSSGMNGRVRLRASALPAFKQGAHPSPLTPHPSPLTPHPSPLTPHPSPLTVHPVRARARPRGCAAPLPGPVGSLAEAPRFICPSRPNTGSSRRALFLRAPP